MAKRKIRILHPSSAGYTCIFEWMTEKRGLSQDVIAYVVEKFSNPASFPKGYQSRPLQAGDRIEMYQKDGAQPLVFEMASPSSYFLVFE